MTVSRLSAAIDGGLILPEDGTVAVLRPPAVYDLSELPHDRMHVVQPFRPDFDYWTTAGMTVTSEMPPAASAVVVVVPRSKALARDMVARACALAPDGLIVVDGNKTDGVDSLFKEARKRLGDVASVTKAHGRLFWFRATDKFADWIAPPPAPGPHGYVTTAGVFSDGSVDRGSALLVANLPPKMKGRVGDLGAGWGYLSAQVLDRAGIKALDLIEAEVLALDCARQNVQDPRAAFHWADAATFRPKTVYDHVICNPPFHTGRAAQPALGRAFITAAAAMLSPRGELWLVANRQLPYEAPLAAAFREVTEIAKDGAFKVFHASRPIR
ncbi:MAG: class I SAM-dependent methyltransferase [Octadecabacter sp.]